MVVDAAITILVKQLQEIVDLRTRDTDTQSPQALAELSPADLTVSIVIESLERRKHINPMLPERRSNLAAQSHPAGAGGAGDDVDANAEQGWRALAAVVGLLQTDIGHTWGPQGQGGSKRWWRR
jgi:hypothetical protein